MDINHEPQNSTPHYSIEYSISADVSNPEAVKSQAYQAMTKLHGWCSNEKACFLMDLIFQTQPKKVVEIGVFGGKSLIPMAFALRANGSGMAFGIDPWSSEESIQGMEDVNKDWWGSIDHSAILKHLVAKISEFQLGHYITLICATSLNAEPIHDIDILHIDGNHSEETSFIDVTKWVPLVKSGGIIIFDDINWSTTSRAVQWLDDHCIKQTEVVGDNIWGVWIKP